MKFSMKKVISVLAVLFVAGALLASCGGQDGNQSASFDVKAFVEGYVAGLPANSNYIVSMDTFVAEVLAGADMYVVDIRQPDVYNQSHIIGAVNVPWGSDAMWEAMSHIPTDKTVFVHCYTGQTAGQAVVTMRMAGIPAISVNSGWNLGISQVEGYEAATESTVNEIDTAYDNGASDEVIAVIRDYYQAMGEKAGTVFANNMVSEDNALKIVEAGDEGVQFVSLRRPADYEAGHIANAVNVPFGADMLDGVSSLPADKKLVAYCYSGQTANQATALLRLLGYDAVSLRFGMGTARTAPNGWANKGFAVVQ